MVILGSPRIPQRGMRVARSVAQRSDALREIGPPDLRISCIHRLSSIDISKYRYSSIDISIFKYRYLNIDIKYRDIDIQVSIYRYSSIDISIFKYRYIDI